MGWLLALSLSFALASGLSEHVEQLGHADPALREAAAAALRASPPPDEQGEAWSARVAQVRDGMTRAQDEALLPVLETGPGLSMGRSIRQSWRLDTYWTVSAIFLRGKLGAGPAGPGAPSPLLLGGAPSGTHGHLGHLVRQRPEEPRDRVPLGRYHGASSILAMDGRGDPARTAWDTGSLASASVLPLGREANPSLIANQTIARLPSGGRSR